MNIYNLLHSDIIRAAKSFTEDEKLIKNIAVETPKDPSHGDLSTNAAMILSKSLALTPRDVATQLQTILAGVDYIENIDIAGPGFLNFRIVPSKWYESIKEILREGVEYGANNIGAGIKVNVEYASPNPTGPMHIGHARGTVYGDALARLLKKCGYDVTKEFYINDAGVQISVLARSTYIRYKQSITGENITIPEGLYPGEYLTPIGARLAEKYGDRFLNESEEKYLPIIKQFAINEMLSVIKSDLKDLGVSHDVFTSEQSLYDAKTVENAIDYLSNQGLVYKGILPPPKGKAQDGWEPKEQLLFKSTELGDSQDRVLKKNDGAWTYFAGDVGYAQNKISRGFNNLICVVGADHSGHVKSMEAAIKSLSNGKVECDIKLCQLVNYIENGQPIKMSKRAGTFTTVSDVVKEVGKDIVRFMMLTRKNDAILDFDLVKVKEQSRDNPVFYVQYAFVRAKSVISNAKEQLPESYQAFIDGNLNLALIDSNEELQLIKMLSAWPKVVEGAAKHFEPHRIAFYLQSLAGLFHSLWNLGKENNSYRFIIEKDPELTASRLALLSAMASVITAGFGIIGIEAIEKCKIIAN